jgi:hypothetical protein
VSSLQAFRRYHEHEARLWERQALIKLRPIAGDRALGAEVARLAEQTVYGAPTDAKQAAEAIGAMKDRIERELGGGFHKRQGGDLKFDAGGVIDVEFATQYLQLVHGHAHPALRTTGTSPARPLPSGSRHAASWSCSIKATDFCEASNTVCGWSTTSQFIDFPSRATSSIGSRAGLVFPTVRRCSSTSNAGSARSDVHTWRC